MMVSRPKISFFDFQNIPSETEQERAERILEPLKEAAGVPNVSIVVVPKTSDNLLLYTTDSFIIVSSTLMKVTTDEELVAGFAHELGHIILRVPDDPVGQDSCDKFATVLLRNQGIDPIHLAHLLSNIKAIWGESPIVYSSCFPVSKIFDPGTSRICAQLLSSQTDTKGPEK